MIGVLALAAAIGLPPVEECGGDPAFAKAREEFAAAVKTRDSTRLAALASDSIEMDDASEEKGKSRLIELMDGELGPDYWRWLEPVIEAGCLDGERFRALPAFVTVLAEGEMVVAGDKEPIRATPSATGKIKGHASWERVDTNFGDSGPEYWHVKLRSGRTGYIRSERIYSNYSPYAVFERQGGQWRLTVLRLIPAD